ncbi:MAG: hypothetical protein ABIH25_04865 [Candidatus Woesearchaeota archaeon]
MASQRKRVQLTKKKKKWYEIYVSKEFGGSQVGESYVSEESNLIGKRLNVDMMIVSKSRNPNVRLVFEVKKVVEGKAIAEPIGYYVLSSYLKRLVRKGKSKLDISYKLKSKDGVDCVFKVFFVTKSKVQGQLSKGMKAELKKLVEGEFKKKTVSEMYDSIIGYTLQKSLKGALSKIYPLQSFEIRMFYRK